MGGVPVREISLKQMRFMKILVCLFVVILLIAGVIALIHRNSDMKDKIPVLSDIFSKYDEFILKRKITKNPYSSSGYYDLAYLYFKRGDIDKFETELKKALEVEPASIASYYSLAHHYETKLQLEKAVELYRVGVKYDTEYTLPFHWDIARVLYNLGRYEEALENYKEALKHIDSYKIINGKETIKKDVEENIKLLENKK